MVFAPLATLLALLPIAVLGGQVPVIDGVYGGVPSTLPKTLTATKASTAAAAAGSLRVTENSGVCGTQIHSAFVLQCSFDKQRQPMVFTKHLVTVTSM